MNRTVEQLLRGQEDNHVLPFFWQHGEDTETIRKMMRAIRGASCRAVCVESRPHPDFCGPKWWEDMDVILEEARSLGMKVWILDDSHFPTGFANGALKDKPDSLCRQGIFLNACPVRREAGMYTVRLREEGLLSAPQKQAENAAEARWFNRPAARVFGDDRIVRVSLRINGEERDITDRLQGENVSFEKGEGDGELRVLVISRNAGCHRDYINMMEKDSVRALIDAVYEPHWEHYAPEFGKTIAGFFSDEPELGNGFLYAKGNVLGSRQDLPWSRGLEEEMIRAFGETWARDMEKLWDGDASPETARVHFLYMDCVTRLVEQNFSEQLGAWCRGHGVMYIGHVIEDDGQHCRTGSSLGHYFRGLSGQDMAGIDDIGGQVLPQGEDGPAVNFMGQKRDGTFYHYGLAKLAQSAAALEERKAGRAMCEIFGNYGWAEGVRLEKYLADHFLVRGINYFVPHAFTGKAFPDPDCPPHFYAHGHHPQYRHFAALMTYMNRAAALTSSGRHRVDAAVLYHGENEWCDGNAMPFEQPLRRLYDAQIDCHTVPADFLNRAEVMEHGPEGSSAFRIGGQTYRVMIVPGCAGLCRAAAEGLAMLAAAGVCVVFAETKPDFVSETGERLPEALSACPAVSLDELVQTVRRVGIPERILPENSRVRLLDIAGDTDIIMAVNEGTEAWEGILRTGGQTSWYLYDAWENVCRPADTDAEGIRLRLEPLHSVFAVQGRCPEAEKRPEKGLEIRLNGWQRSVCEGKAYPAFSEPVQTAVPDGDRIAEEMPEFSGFVRYDGGFDLDEAGQLVLEIQDAEEGVEVFLNGESAGIQIVPPFRYVLNGRSGRNTLRIEVATTLERECYPLLEGYRKLLAGVPSRGSGITGNVRLWRAQ